MGGGWSARRANIPTGDPQEKTALQFREDLLHLQCSRKNDFASVAALIKAILDDGYKSAVLKTAMLRLRGARQLASSDGG